MNSVRFPVGFIFILHSFIAAQTVTSIIVDQKTKEPVPFATIQLAENDGVLTNEEGRFSFIITDKLSTTDSIYISSMGYEKIGIALQNPLDSIIYIEPKVSDESHILMNITTRSYSSVG